MHLLAKEINSLYNKWVTEYMRSAQEISIKNILLFFCDIFPNNVQRTVQSLHATYCTAHRSCLFLMKIFAFLERVNDWTYPIDALRVNWHKNTKNVTKLKIHHEQINNKEQNQLFQNSISACISKVLNSYLEDHLRSLSKIECQTITQSLIINFKISLKIECLSITFRK